MSVLRSDAGAGNLPSRRRAMLCFLLPLSHLQPTRPFPRPLPDPPCANNNNTHGTRVATGTRWQRTNAKERAAARVPPQAPTSRCRRTSTSRASQQPEPPPPGRTQMAQSNAMAVAAAALLMLAIAPAAVTAVTCGSLGEVALSGCISCAPFNMTKGNKTHWGSGGGGGERGGRNLLDAAKPPQPPKPPGPGPSAMMKGGGVGGGGWGGKPPGSFLVPNCSVCDDSANFTLRTTWGWGGGHGGKQGGHGRHLLGGDGWGWGGGNKTRNKTRPGRCVCKPGFGVVVTGNATITIPGKGEPITVPLFRCEACAGNTVPLTPMSGLAVQPDGSIVLGNWTKGGPHGAFAKAAGANNMPPGNRPPMPPGARFDGPPGGPPGGGGGKKGPHLLPGGLVPGSCVPCPDGSTATADHVKCVANGA